MEQKITPETEPAAEPAVVPEPDSLEAAPTSSVITPESGADTGSEQPVSGGDGKPPKKKRRSLRDRLRDFNIYLMLFILVLIIAGAIVGVLYLKNRNATVKETTNSLNSQNLSTDALQQLANNAVQIGDPQQVLNVQSNSIFSGTVLVRGQLQAANGLKVGGDLAINGLSVSGSGTVNKLQTQDLAVSGNTAVRGRLTVQGSLSAGGASFSSGISAPTVTTNSLQLGGPLTVANHIITGGPRPGADRSSAVGTGGTININGNDTAGTININTGGSPGAGCFASVSFARPFNGQPHVVATPVGSTAGTLQWYITRTTSGFSVCSNTPAPANSSFGFDYIVLN